MIVYLNKEYIDEDKAFISPNDRGFLFADGLYEVVQSYNGSLFRAEDHFQRLAKGVDFLKIDRSEIANFQTILEELILRNSFTNKNAGVYYQITRGAASRTHSFPDPKPNPTVYAFIKTMKNPLVEGINNSAILVPDQRWARCDMKTIGLIPNILSNQKAKEQNCIEALFVRDGMIMEGSCTNFFAVIDEKVITAPATNYILSGITRKAVIELCKKNQIPIIERAIFLDEIKCFDEAFICGTITEIAPIAKIDNHKIGDKSPGPITKALQQAFKKLVEKEIQNKKN